MKTEKKTVIKNFDFSDYINKLRDAVKGKELTFEILNNIFEPANVIFTNYEDYINTVVDEKEKEAAPTKEEFKFIASKQKGFAFALYDTNIDKINVVVELDAFIKKLDSDQIKVLEMTLNHESIHVQQAEQIGKENYKLDISPFRDPEGYFSREDEIMAYANSAVYELLNIHSCSKENIPNIINAVFVPNYSIVYNMKNFLSDENYELFKEYVLLYLQDETTSEEIKKEKVCVVKNMKQKVKEEIYSKNFKGNFQDIRFSDLPKDIQQNDIIEIHREESFYSENDSYDAYTELVVIREREETDEEYQKRNSKNEKFKQELKKRRYENYLKLKIEFEK